MSENFENTIKKEDEKWMQVALQQAEIALQQHEIPIGAALVRNNKLLYKTYNQVELLRDVTAHAEMMTIASASEHFQNKYLKGTTLYVTLEPCAMCAAAIGWAQIERLVFAASDYKKGYRILSPNVLHPKCEVVYGVLNDKSEQLLHHFFKNKR